MSENVLEMKGVVKRYGRVTALDGLDLAVPRGVICGLIGPNGAGKTTTFGVVSGLIRPDEGVINVLGLGPFRPAEHVGRLTVLPQDCELNPYTTVRQLLIYYAALQGMSRHEARTAADRVLDWVALSDRAGFRVKQLSHGMRRRVQVAQAFLGEPELVLLDEPTSGLDPELVMRMRELFESQRGDRTLVISSHNLLELEAICDHVVFMEHGRCVRAGTLDDVTGRGTWMRYLLEAPVDLDGHEGLGDMEFRWESNYLVVEASSELSAADINAKVLPALGAAGGRIIEIRQGRSLEAAYMANKQPDL